jgi:undecaprenyl diphosphate synthase
VATRAGAKVYEFGGTQLSQLFDPQRKPPKFEKVPAHIAVVMDGNGRWANQRGLTRTEGHKAGELALLEVIAGAIEAGVSHLTAYAFSTENWKRSPEEVRFLMGYNKEVLRRRRDLLNEWNVQIIWAGRKPKLWPSVISELEEAVRHTAKNTGLTLTMAVNYGGRQEIIDAVNLIAKQVYEGKLMPGKVNEKHLQKALYEPSLPDVDLFLRSSGEMRTSNFMLWQSSYAEMMFLETLWPDFTRETLWDAILAYQNRDRRFGAALDAPLN